MTCSILVVDDEPNLRLTLAQILQDAGYQVSTASNAVEALECLAGGAFDLAFLDLKMPDVDGMTLFREIHRLYPDLLVLILTGHATLESATEAVRLGARDYIFKPVDPERILGRIAEILNDRRQPERRREILQQINGLLTELNGIDLVRTPELAVDPAIASASARLVQRGSLALDLRSRQVTLGSRPVPLSGAAFDYLLALARHAPAPVSFQALVFEAQGYQVTRPEAQDMVRWWVHQLRKAVEPDAEQPQYILTVRGTGYRLVL